MLTLRDAELKGFLEGKGVAFKTHDNPHLDEAGALLLIEKFGTEEFLNRYAKDGMILVGIGGGDFDEHPRTGQEGKNGDCAMSLVAKALGVEEDPALEKILKFITNSDLKGSSHPFDLASLLYARYQCSCNGAPENKVSNEDRIIFDPTSSILLVGLTFSTGGIVCICKALRGFLNKKMFGKLVDYIKGTRVELKSVSWPTKKQTINFTLLVIGVSLAVAAFLGFFDMFFSFLLKKFIL